MIFLSHRVIEPELLDHAEEDEAKRNLRDLVRINTYLGGHGVIRRMLAAHLPVSAPFTLLDVAAASGDTARTINRRYPLASVTSLDYNAVNLQSAPAPKLLGDAFQLPFGSDSFDYVLSSLFLHHFPDEQVIQLLKNFYKTARRALFIADLERHVLPYLFLPATRYVFGWQRLTLHDGPTSVRAAFRAGELQELAKAAGITDPIVRHHRPAFRLSLTALK